MTRPVTVQVIYSDDHTIRSEYLTDGERRQLAMQARYQADWQEDPRYWDPDPAERERLRSRWEHIAELFHRDPFGQEASDGR